MKKEIKILNERFFIYLDKEYIGDFESLIEAQDELDDAYTAAMSGEHKYHCQFCQEYFNEDQVEHRVTDNRFTAPYGSTWVLGGNLASIAVCPICESDMEEC